LLTGLFLIGARVPVSASAYAADPCAHEAAQLALRPDDGDARNRLGWCRYRAQSFGEAAIIFGQQIERHPGDADATVGLAYTQLQQGDVAAARTLFREVLKRHDGYDDARRGLSLAALREPGEELRFRPDADPGRPIAVPARALVDYLEVREADGSYAPIFVKGVNLGAGLPGKHPTEFPRDAAVYLRWLDTIAGLGMNAVRVYTLLPPEFYRALATHNALSGVRKLWLIQGVWAELPDTDDFADADYVDEFEQDIARVIDAVHGDLVTPPRPGHASGAYEADASSSLLALVVGREWEPYAVQAFNAKYPERTAWRGTYFSVQDASAMETWVARMCDFAAGYEVKRYRTLHPLTFANWPTLDPLHHETESSRHEENAWRTKYGLPFPEAYRERAWDNDAVSLDATKIAATAAMPSGFFAVYHIYPNYPDFLNLKTRYEAYLGDLKRYHGHQPVLVAEFGISTSRGIAHVQPDGWNHGGHDEKRQGELLSSMLSAIHAKGYAGGVVFEFMDEWFKSTWSTTALTIPHERGRLWFNAESPEESYGLMANRPSSPVRVDGDPSDWTPATLTSSRRSRGGHGWSALRELRVASDEGYLYVLLRTEGGPSAPDWADTALRLAIDTYDPARGITRLPDPGAATIASGAEFLVELRGPGASFVTVAAPYEPYAAIDRGPIASPLNVRDGSVPFVPLRFETNRERIGRDGTRYPPIVVDRGALRYGSLDPEAKDRDTRTDVAVGAAYGAIELRLPWALLNVTDPSSRRVLHQESEHEAPLDTVAIEGFRIYAFAFDPSRSKRGPLSRLPAAGVIAPLYAWAPWDEPKSRTEPKAGFETIRATLHALPDRPARPAAGTGGVLAP
jgi:hypothetical protein